MTRLEAGTLAPDFTLTDQDGGSVRLKDLRGQKVILYFYPEAMTPGCALEACDFRDSWAPLQAAGFTVLGVSPDPVDKLERFRDRDDLPFTLLSDEKHVAMTKYSTWGEKLNYGKTYMGVIRSTFVIDEKGRITQALYNVRATGHVARVLKLVGVAA